MFKDDFFKKCKIFQRDSMIVFFFYFRGGQKTIFEHIPSQVFSCFLWLACSLNGGLASSFQRGWVFLENSNIPKDKFTNVEAHLEGDK